MTETIMGLDRTHPRMLSIEALLDGIGSGSVVLPDFQRDFDWTESDVRSLLVTVLSGWPAGSLLLMTADRLFFRVRGLEGGPAPSEDLQFVVLDGQQRLTGLYHAFRNSGPTVYTLDWSRVKAGAVDDLEEAVVSHDRLKWERELNTYGAQLARTLVPLFALASASDYFTWRDGIVGAAPTDARDQLSRDLSDLYRKVLANAQSYEFPAVVITSRISPAAIARIFERVNRSGLTLSAFDLMVAISYEPGWNLRDHWEDARRDHGLIDTYLGEDGLPILQIIALRTARNIREQAVLNLSGSVVRQEFAGAVDGIDEALSFVQSLGATTPAWLPYRLIPVVLAALAEAGSLEEAHSRLSQWFWSTGFGETFDVASNTRAVADFGILSRGIPAGAPVSLTVLRDSTRRRNSAIWRSFMAALVANGAQDVLTGSLLGVDGSLHETVVLPVLPRLNLPAGDVSPHLKVMNLILASRGTARRIRSIGFWPAVESEPAAEMDLRLSSQFLPGLTDLDASLAQWPDLLRARASLLAEFLSNRDVQVDTKGD
jgi:hypothetical protein